MERKTEVVELTIRRSEIDALLSCNESVRYKYAIKRMADTEYIWTVVDNCNMCSIQIKDDMGYFPVWSSKEFAIDFCTKYFKESVCVPIYLYDFFDSIVDSLVEEGYMVNVFPTHLEEFGKVVGVKRFCEDLKNELKKYD